MDQLERKFGGFTFPFLLPVLLIGQVMVYLATLSGTVPGPELALYGSRVYEGEVWRLFTFMVLPLNDSPIWFALGIYITWLIGSSLEEQWGEFRFGLFIGLGWLLTVCASLMMPGAIMGNFFIYGSLTLAFSRLFPNVEFLLFFVIPVKVKYIGYVLGGMFLLFLLGGPVSVKLQVLAVLIPLMLFFGGEMLGLAKARKRKGKFQRETARPLNEPFHVCSQCGRTDQSDPELQFRYLGETCICERCLNEGKHA